MALGASYATSVISVVTGTTLGMLLADVPAVFIGNKLSEKLSMKWMRRIAAAILCFLRFWQPLPTLPTSDPSRFAYGKSAVTSLRLTLKRKAAVYF